MKVVTVLGARPQFIKAATISRVIADNPDVQEVIVHTGQHYDANMSDIFFHELDIPKPHYNLEIGGGLHGAMTGRQLEAIERVLIDEKPDWVLVYGDTNSTLAGALASAKLNIPLAHVESGLRSFNRRMPEEINRIVTDHVATKLLAPTEIAMNNLRSEGLPADRLFLVGDVMYDASLFYRKRAQKPLWYDGSGAQEGCFVLATIHRAENTDDPVRLMGIMQGLGATGLMVLLPLHPRTRDRLESAGISLPPNVRVVDPVGYLEMVWLEERCALVATDSGGVQKEAYFFGKPCVTLREETEWVELVQTGWNVLVGADPDKIAVTINSACVPKEESQLYGDGNAASKVVAAMQ